MRKIVMTLALCGALAGCATPQQDGTARAETCIAEIEETTGSRVESTPDCKPAPSN